MALTQAQRDALPLSSYGDPAHRLYPITNAASVMAAAHLVGKAPASEREAIKARIIEIAKRKGYPIPAAWQ